MDRKLVAIQEKPDYVPLISDVLSKHTYVSGYEGYSCCKRCDSPYRYGYDTKEEFYDHQAREVLKALGVSV